MTLTIGVLGLQGAFHEHVSILSRIPGVTSVRVIRSVNDLNDGAIDALVIPGGESTSMMIIAERNGLVEPLREFVKCKPVWGTCAGLILLSKVVQAQKTGGQGHFPILDIAVSRNRYGSQIDSFQATVKTIFGESEGVFIRAPGILKVLEEDNVQVIGRIDQGEDEEEVVAVRQGWVLGMTFHPELTNDTRWHEYFVEMVKEFVEQVRSRPKP